MAEVQVPLKAPAITVPGMLVFRALYGSHAHGTATPTSDEDWRGVYLLPNENFLGLDRPELTFEDREHDQVFWELGHFCRLLLKGNPNIVGMLFAPDDVLNTIHRSFRPLLTEAWRFVHEGTIAAYMGWVHRELRDIGKLHKGNAKRLSHVPRLLWEIEGAASGAGIEVRPTGYRHERIMAIKTGAMDYDEAVAYCGELLLDVEHTVESHRPYMPPPRDWLRAYLLGVREEYGRG